MPIQPCPKCQRPTARLLTGVSHQADVNYYRCEPCGHVWTLPKGPEAEFATPKDVTIKREQAS